MATNEEEKEIISHVKELEVPKTAENDWEVVSLTASTYAASPSPRADESNHEDIDSTVSGNDETETSQVLFMSGNFVFLPNQHENLPVVPEKIVIPKDVREDDLVAEMNLLQESKSKEKIDKNWRIEGLDVTEDFRYIPLVEEKGHMKLSTHVPEYNEPISPHGLNVVDKEQDLFDAAKLVSLHSATVIGYSEAYDESAILNEQVEPSVNAIDLSSPSSQTPKFVDEDEADDTELPCGDWWKRGVSSLCAQAKEAGAFWSIFVAAAVVGLVVLGQRWQQERWQTLQQRSQLSIGDEKSGRILSGLKDVIVGGSHRGAYVTAASAEL